MPVDQKIEIELALQDQASQTIQAIAASVSDVVKNIGAMGNASTGTDSGIARSVRSVQALGEKSKETGKSLSTIAAILAPMAGAAGTVALIGTGLIAATNALGEFAKGGLKLKNLSVDIGFSVDQMSVMTRTFERMGMDAGEAQKHMTAIGQALKNIQTYGNGSEIIRTLSQMGHGAFATQLLQTVKAGEFYQAFNMINQEFNRLYTVEGPAAAANFRSTIGGLTESIAKNYAERSKGVQPAIHANIKEMQRFNNILEEYKTRISNAWSKLLDDYMGYQIKFKNFMMGLEPFTRKPPTEPNASQSLGGIRRRKKTETLLEDGKEEKKETNKKLETIRNSLQSLGGAKPKKFGGPVEQGQRYLVGEARPELYIGGGDVRLLGMDGPEIIQPATSGTIIADAGEALRSLQPSLVLGDGGLGPSFNSGRSSDQAGQSFFGGITTPSGSGYDPGQVIQSAMTEPSSNWAMPMFNDHERRQLDINLQAEMSAPSLSVSSDITFRNVPPGVTTMMNGEGFDNFKVNKSKALGDA